MLRIIQVQRVVILVICLGGLSLTEVSAQAQAPVEDPYTTFAMALRDFRAGRYDWVIQVLEETVRKDSRDAPSHHLLGLAYSMRGDIEEAAKHLERSLELAPGHPIYSANLARLHLGEGNPAEAEKVLDESLGVKPTPEVYRMLGLLRLEKRNGGEAFAFFEKAMKLNPQDVQSWYYMGLSHHAYGHFDEAETCYRQALELEPGDFHAHFQLGKLYAFRRSWTEALAHFRSALEIRKDISDVYRYLSQAETALGELESALLHAREAVQLNPEDVTAHFQLGRTLVRMGRRDEAREHLRYIDRQKVESEPTLSQHWQQVLRGSSLASPNR